MAKEDYKDYFNISLPSTVQHVRHRVSYFYNAEVRDAIETVIDGQVSVGQLPRQDMLAVIHHLEVKRVVSCCQHFELAGQATGYTVVRPEDWSKHNIEHFHLPYEDFEGEVSPVLVINALDYLFSKPEHAFVHCKAGRGRSGLLSTLYCLIAESESLALPSIPSMRTGELIPPVVFKRDIELALQRVQVRRSVVALHDKQRSIAYEVWSRIVREGYVQLSGNKLIWNGEKVREARAARPAQPYLQSDAFYAELVQNLAFKQLWTFTLNSLGDNSHFFSLMQSIFLALHKEPKRLTELLVAALTGGPPISAEGLESLQLKLALDLFIHGAYHLPAAQQGTLGKARVLLSELAGVIVSLEHANSVSAKQPLKAYY